MMALARLSVRFSVYFLVSRYESVMDHRRLRDTDPKSDCQASRGLAGDIDILL
jgi:hypothetical protein